jgi:hypothetical protein
MAGFELSEEYQDLSNTVREFADEVVAPVSAKHDEEHSFPYEVVKQMAEMGLFGLPFPEEFGGMGGDYFALALALEQLGRVDQSVAITLEAGVSLGAMPVYRFGTEEQKQEWLPMLASGQALAGFGLTEPEAGSDAGGTKTHARREGGQWVINGNKEFITNSGTDITRLVTVTAVTGQKERADGSVQKEISTILVPTDTPGFKAEKPYNKVGWNASDTHPLTLKDVRVPEANLLGAEGRGYANFLSILDEAASPSRHWLPAPPRAAWTCRSNTPRSAAPSATGSASTRPFRSRSPAWKQGRTQRALPTTMRRSACLPESRSRPRRPSLRWSQARRPWTMRGMPPRCSAAMASSTSSPWHATTATPRSLK